MSKNNQKIKSERYHKSIFLIGVMIFIGLFYISFINAETYVTNYTNMSVTGNFYQKIKTLTINDGVTNFTNEIWITAGTTAYSIIQFNYENGTSINTSVQSSPYIYPILKVWTIPDNATRISTIDVWLKEDAGVQIGNEGFTNATVVTIAPASTPILVNLTTPANATTTSITTNTFIVNLSISGTNYSYSWINNTYNIWFSNGTLFNSTLAVGLSTNSTTTSRNMSGFILENYLWNSYACYGNTTFNNCSWATSNNTFTVGSTINSILYQNSTFETSLEQFIVNLSLFTGAEVSLAQIYYNGTNYTIANVSHSGNNYIFEKKINIPLNVNPLGNQTNEFYVRFTYSGNSVQLLGPYYQNSSFINLVKCGGAYAIQALNFTFYDGYNQINIASTTNKTTLYSSFKYWLGEGSVYKNYSFQNLSSTLNNYQFCIYPYASNITFKTDMDMEFYADSYRDNKYYLRNSSLTNISNDILLYLTPEDYATKFFLSFKNGINIVSGGTVNVQQYFTGLGMYKTVAILLTDEDGKATMWQEVDKSYRYSIVQNGVLLGIIDRVSICSATPCSLTIMVTQPIGSAFQAYDEYYAKNILSNISYNKTSKMVTYTFIDTTGLANYFRFEVIQTKVDGVAINICNSFSYSSAGTLNCNLSGYYGDFVATGYISRSPEKVDNFLSFVIDEDVLANLGTIGVLIVMILIITLVIAAAVMSKGNPTTVLFVLGLAILGTKLIGLFPFSWVVTVSLEVLIIFFIFKLKT